MNIDVGVGEGSLEGEAVGKTLLRSTSWVPLMLQSVYECTVADVYCIKTDMSVLNIPKEFMNALSVNDKVELTTILFKKSIK